MSKLVGVWNLASSENWDEYLKELGVGMVTRKASSAIKPTVIIENAGSEWTLKLQSSLKNSEVKGVEGVAFEETTMDGRKVNTTLALAGAGKLVQTQVDQKTGSVSSVITREIVGDELVQVNCLIRFYRTCVV